MPGGVVFGELPMVKQFFKGVFQQRPALPKNTVTWNPSLLLAYLKTLEPLDKITLKELTLKLTSLLAILSGQRQQTIHLLDIRNIEVSSSIVKISVGDTLKHTKPGKHLHELELPAYPHDRRICIVTVIQEYLHRTEPLRGNCTRLLVSFVRPYGQVSKNTIARWIKSAMGTSGIDLSRFTPHSTRASATSTACKRGVSLQTICKTAGWSSSSTFAKFYNKPTYDYGEVAKSILS